MRDAILVFVIGVFLLIGAGYWMYGGFFKEAEVRKVSFSTIEEVNTYFKNPLMSLEAWRQRQSKVPALELMDIPKSWGENVAPSLKTAEKKTMFLRFAIPLVLIANAEIQKDRARLLDLVSSGAGEGDQKWLRALGQKYRIDYTNPDEATFKKLLQSVDIIPVSLAVAQMIEESGWGTSRFAAEGNALFGQWTFGGGIKPKAQREEKGDYRIKTFKTPLASVKAYMLNLNSNAAYNGFRLKRAALRKSGQAVLGTALVESLHAYSERGLDYIASLKGIMRVNKLAPFDKAALEPVPRIEIRL